METLPKNAKIYTPADGLNIKGVIQIIHGMAEHQMRYKALADYLCGNGFVVITSDLRGHGNNVKRDEELGYFGDNALLHLIADVHDITSYVKYHYSHIPYFILGHSMGTLIATNYLKKYDNFIDGMFLSGMPGKNNMTGVAKFLIKTQAYLHGEYYRSPLINNLCNGPFSKAFSSEGSKFAWLSSDSTNVRLYENDPKCGYVFTLNGFYTLMDLMDGTYKNNIWIMKNKDCPIVLMSGADDPCMGNKKNFMKSVELFKDAGYKNVSHVLFSGQRHEIFNDTEKEKAMEYLLNSLNSIIKNKEDSTKLKMDMFK